QELQEVKDYFNEQSAGLGDAFIIYFQKQTDLIAKNPFLFQKVYANKRRAIIEKFRYNIIYVVHDDQVLILGILHGSRNPASWKNR
ncbi:MAG: type II toxin-antitoxin system RelE/ParE family toxin, partial [Saprospiraceae bacterium]|nr:type II toxin-antitoxin system RelE/ParE family toxin [Saprospiraceae bacterium]